jgi:crotonobetainyl-CoA:carnitine CoA-transferase CaiB-like acyl-CoA transferase
MKRSQTNGNTLPIFTGEGTVTGIPAAAGFQPYDTFKCSDGWVFIGALGGAIYARVPRSSVLTQSNTATMNARRMPQR